MLYYGSRILFVQPSALYAFRFPLLCPRRQPLSHHRRLGRTDGKYLILTCRPSGFGMRTSATWQHQYTRITSLHRLDVVMEPPFCFGMMEHVTILLWRPLHVVLAHTAPLEARIARWRISEVIHLVSCLPQPRHHLRMNHSG